MNKILASTGLVALSAASLQAAAPGYGSPDSAKPWSLTTALRGFYDSNSTTSQDEEESFGVGLELGAGYNWTNDQSFLGFDYTYGLKWYEARESGSTDQSHKFGVKFDHAFSERSSLSVKDTLTYSNQPRVDDGGAPQEQVLRTERNNLRNRANVDFTAQLTPLLGVGVGYQNSFHDYDQDAGDVHDPLLNPNGVNSPSYSQLLDRMEHLFIFDTRWQLLPETVFIAGYTLGLTGYDDSDAYFVADPALGATLVSPDWRDKTSHFAYVGADYNASSRVNATVKLGVEISDYTDLPTGSGFDDNITSPYADASVSYLYNPGSYLLFGYRHIRNATDLQIQDAESDVVYLSVTHRVTPKLSANGLLQFQFSQFEDYPVAGAFGEIDDTYITAGVSLSYMINEMLSTEFGYNYDNSDSDIATRDYDRHMVYTGIRATF